MHLNNYLSGGRLQRLVLKELRESLRDRRTVITLVLMPILVYPLLGMVLQRLLLGTAAEKARDSFIIGVSASDRAEDIDRLLYEAQMLIHSGANTVISPQPWGKANGNATDGLLKLEDKNESRTDKAERTAERTVEAPEAVAGSNSREEDGPGNPKRGPSAESGGINNQTQIPKFELVLVDGTTLERALDRGSIDIAINRMRKESREGNEKPKSPRVGRFQPGQREAIYFNGFDVELLYRQGDARSEDAAFLFRRMCHLVNDQQLHYVLNATNPGLEPAVKLTSLPIGKPLNTAASIAAVIPLVLILMTITGAVYPAIDLTAGERERGTMEAMIATPAPRFALLLSKYFAVVTVSILTALANLFATWMTLSFGGLGRAIFGEGGFGIGTLLQILPILVIFAGFFSSILLALCSFAKTFKEAQAYLIPVMLVSLAPGLVTLMPNIEFSNTLAVVPLLNVLLLSRDIMTGVPQLVPSVIAIVTTIAYGGAALVIASHLFGAANSMSSSQLTWRELIRGTGKANSVPDIGALAIYLAFLFPILFMVSSLNSFFAGQTELVMGLNAVTLLVLFLILPIVWVAIRRASVIQTFLLAEFSSKRFREENLQSSTHGSSSDPQRISEPELSWEFRIRPQARWCINTLGVLLLAGTLWMFALEAVLLFKSWSLSSLVPDLDEVKAKWLAIPFLWILITQAIVPAIAEEFFFRGFALSSLRSRINAIWAVILSALLFGGFHVITGNVLSLERFVPTVMLGLILGYIAVMTRSIWPGVVLHACHNSLVLGFSRLEKEQLSQWFGDGDHIPAYMLVAGGCVASLAVLLLWWGNLGAARPEKFSNSDL